MVFLLRVAKNARVLCHPWHCVQLAGNAQGRKRVIFRLSFYFSFDVRTSPKAHFSIGLSFSGIKKPGS
jgi:hypothetical protein